MADVAYSPAYIGTSGDFETVLNRLWARHKTLVVSLLNIDDKLLNVDDKLCTHGFSPELLGGVDDQLCTHSFLSFELRG